MHQLHIWASGSNQNFMSGGSEPFFVHQARRLNLLIRSSHYRLVSVPIEIYSKPHAKTLHGAFEHETARHPNRARELLKQRAIQQGANAVASLTREKFTEQDGCSNYHYTVHRFDGISVAQST